MKQQLVFSDPLHSGCCSTPAGRRAVGFFARAVCNNPRHEPSTGMLAAILRLYTRIVHRVRYEGLGLIPPSGRPTLLK